MRQPDYGFPFCCNNVGLIYNKDVLKESGESVPKTWEELAQTAKKLTRPGRYGFAMSAIGGEQGAFQFTNFMLSAGDDLDQAGGEGTLKAFTYIHQTAILEIKSSGKGSLYGIWIVPLLVLYGFSISPNTITASSPAYNPMCFLFAAK